MFDPRSSHHFLDFFLLRKEGLGMETLVIACFDTCFVGKVWYVSFDPFTHLSHLPSNVHRLHLLLTNPIYVVKNC